MAREDALTRDIRSQVKKAMGPVPRYASGVAKLFLASGKDFFTSNMPAPGAMISTNADLLSDAVRFLRNPVDAVNRQIDRAMQTDDFKALQKFAKNALDDLKTGNLYDPNRDRTELGMQMDFDMDTFGGFDLDGFDSDGEWQDLDTADKDIKTQVRIAEAQEDNAGRRTAATIDAIGSSTEAIVNTNNANAQMSLRMSVKQHSQQMMAMQNMVAAQSATFELINRTTNASMNVVREAHNQMMSELGEMKTLLTQIRDGVTPPDTSKQYKEQESVFGNNGELDIRKYMKRVVRNVDEKYGISSMISTATVGMSLKDLFELVADNPLKMFSDLIVSNLVDPKIKKHMERTNANMESFFPALLQKFADRGKMVENGQSTRWQDALLGFLGVEAKSKSQISTSYENPLKQVSFTSKTARAIEEVIPMWLSRIDSHIAGTPLMVYNYTTGKLEKATSVLSQNEHNVRDIANRSSAASEIYDRANAYNFKTREEKENFQNYIYQYLQAQAQEGRFINPYRGKDEFMATMPDVSNKDMYYNLLTGILKTMPRDQLMQLSRDMYEGRLSRDQNTFTLNKDLKDSGLISAWSGFLDETISAKLTAETRKRRNGLSSDEIDEILREKKESFRKNGGVVATNEILNDILGTLRKGIVTYGYHIGDVAPTDTMSSTMKSVLENAKAQVKTDENAAKLAGKYKERRASANKRDLEGVKIAYKDPTRRFADFIVDSDITDDMAETIQKDIIIRSGSTDTNNPAVEAYRKAFKQQTDAINGKRDQLVEKTGIGKIMNILRTTAEEPFRLFDQGMKLMDAFMFKALFGEDAAYGIEADGEPYLLQVLTNSLNTHFKNAKDDFTKQVLDPTKDYILNERYGLLPRIGDRIEKFLDKAVEKTGERLGKVKEKFVGVKDTETKRWSGGRFSSAMNKFEEAGDTASERIFHSIDRLLYGDYAYSTRKGVGEETWIAGPDGSITKGSGKQYGGVIGRMKQGFDTLSDVMFGPDSDDPDDKSGKSAYAKRRFKQVKSELNKAFPDMIIGGGLGLLTSFFLPGGPIIPALVGSGIGLLKGSEQLKEFLFGAQEDVLELDYNGNPVIDKKTGMPKYRKTRKGALISNEVYEGVKKFVPSMTKGALAGAVAGGIGLLPFGMSSTAGMVLGAIGGMGAASDQIKQLIFGDGINPDSGLISKNFKEKMSNGIKKFAPPTLAGAFAGGAVGHVLDMGLGLIPGLSIIPGGPIMSLMGAMTGAANADHINKFFFGEEVETETEVPDGKGGTKKVRKKERQGGLFGRAFDFTRDKIITPAAKKFDEVGHNIGEWFHDSIVTPLKNSMDPVKKNIQRASSAVFNAFLNMGDHITTALFRVFNIDFGEGGFREFVKSTLMPKVKDTTNNFFSAIGKVIGNVLSAPFKALEFLVAGTISGKTVEEMRDERAQAREERRERRFQRRSERRHRRGERRANRSADRARAHAGSFSDRLRDFLNTDSRTRRSRGGGAGGSGSPSSGWFGGPVGSGSGSPDDHPYYGRPIAYSPNGDPIYDPNGMGSPNTPPYGPDNLGGYPPFYGPGPGPNAPGVNNPRRPNGRGPSAPGQSPIITPPPPPIIYLGDGSTPPDVAAAQAALNQTMMNDDTQSPRGPKGLLALPPHQSSNPLGLPAPGPENNLDTPEDQKRKEDTEEANRKRQTRKHKRDAVSYLAEIAKYTRVIRDEVKGQLGGVGWNTAYIKAQLDRQYGPLNPDELPEEMEGSTKKVRKKRGLLGRAKDRVTDFLGSAKDRALGAFSSLKGKAGYVVDVVTSPFRWLINGAREAGAALSGLKNGAKEFISDLRGLFKEVGSIFFEAAHGAVHAFNEFLSNAAEGFGESLGNLMEFVTGSFMDLTLMVTSTVRALFETAAEFVPDLGHMAMNGLRKFGGKVFGLGKREKKSNGFFDRFRKHFSDAKSKRQNRTKTKRAKSVYLSGGKIDEATISKIDNGVKAVPFPYVDVIRGIAKPISTHAIPVYILGVDPVSRFHMVTGNGPDNSDKLFKDAYMRADRLAENSSNPWEAYDKAVANAHSAEEIKAIALAQQMNANDRRLGLPGEVAGNAGDEEGSIFDTIFGSGIKGLFNSLLGKAGAALGGTKLGKILLNAGSKAKGALGTASSLFNVASNGMGALGLGTLIGTATGTEDRKITGGLKMLATPIYNLLTDGTATKGGMLSTTLKTIGQKLGIGTAKAAAGNADNLAASMTKIGWNQRITNGLHNLGLKLLGGVDDVVGSAGNLLALPGTVAEKATLATRIGNVVANAGTKFAEKAATSTGVKGLASTVLTKIMGLASKVLANKKVTKILDMLGHGGSLASKALQTFKTKLGKVLANVTSETLEQIAKKLGIIITVATAVYDFVSGYNEAANILRIDSSNLTTGMRVAAAFAKCLSGLAFGLIPVSWFTETLYKLFASKDNDEALDDAQTRFKEAAAVSGMTLEDYNNQQNKTTWQSVKDTVSGAWDSVKSGVKKLFGFGTGRMKNFSQTAGRWNRGSSDIAQNGCGPTVAAMVASAYGKRGNPAEANASSYAMGMRAPDGGTNPAFFSRYAAGKGYGMTQGPTSSGMIESNLKKGRPVVLMGKGGAFGSNMHYLVADKSTGRGQVNIVDPLTGGNKSTSLGALMQNTKSTVYSYGKGPGNAAQNAIVNAMQSKEGKLRYTLDSPQDPDQGWASCASTVGWAYKKALGGDFTKNPMSASSTTQSRDSRFSTIWKNDGKTPFNESMLEPGDIVYINWKKTKDDGLMGHTEMYIGNGMDLSHGGPNTGDIGPVKRELTDYRKKHIMRVRRYNDFINGNTVTYNDVGPTTSDGTESGDSTESSSFLDKIIMSLDTFGSRLDTTLDNLLNGKKSEDTGDTGTDSVADTTGITATTTTLTGNSNGKKIYNYLIGKGFTKNQAFGIMGNLYKESGLLSNNLQNSYNKSLGLSDAQYTAGVDDKTYKNFTNDQAGYGLAQWTSSSRKAGLLNSALNSNKSISDLGLQLDYLWYELNNGYKKSVLDPIKKSSTIRDASTIFMQKFEVPDGYKTSAKINERAQAGEQMMNTYGTGAPKLDSTFPEVHTWGKGDTTNLVSLNNQIRKANSTINKIRTDAEEKSTVAQVTDTITSAIRETSTGKSGDDKMLSILTSSLATMIELLSAIKDNTTKTDDQRQTESETKSKLPTARANEYPDTGVGYNENDIGARIIDALTSK